MKQKGLAPIYLLVGVVILGVILLIPIPYYQNQSCISEISCPQPEWKLGNPLWMKFTDYFVLYKEVSPNNKLSATALPLSSPTTTPPNLSTPFPKKSPTFSPLPSHPPSPSTKPITEPLQELTIEEYKTFKPYPPYSIDVKRTQDGILISWSRIYSDSSRESDLLSEYRLYRRKNESTEWKLITVIRALEEKSPYIKPSNFYLDSTSEGFEYAVSVVSIYGVEGFKGETAGPAP